MARIRDLGINFIPTPSRTDIELTPVVMAAADGDEENYKECDSGPGNPCSLTVDGDDDCDGPENNCSLTVDEDCDGPGNNCSLTVDEDCDGPENNCSLTVDDDCDGPKNNCSLTVDEDEDDDDQGGPKKSTKGLRACDVAQLTEQLEDHLANELPN